MPPVTGAQDSIPEIESHLLRVRSRPKASKLDRGLTPDQSSSSPLADAYAMTHELLKNPFTRDSLINVSDFWAYRGKDNDKTVRFYPVLCVVVGASND